MNPFFSFSNNGTSEKDYQIYTKMIQGICATGRIHDSILTSFFF